MSDNDYLTESDIEHFSAVAALIEELFDAGWQPDAEGREIVRSLERVVGRDVLDAAAEVETSKETLAYWQRRLDEKQRVLSQLVYARRQSDRPADQLDGGEQ